MRTNHVRRPDWTLPASTQDAIAFGFESVQFDEKRDQKTMTCLKIHVQDVVGSRAMIGGDVQRVF